MKRTTNEEIQTTTTRCSSEETEEDHEMTAEEDNNQVAEFLNRKYSYSPRSASNQNDCSNQTQATNNSDGSDRPKRNPYCSRCRNHGKIAQVKGHKRHCEYRECQCEGCNLVEWRQKISAAQIKRRRYQKQDEECGRRIEITPPVLTRESNSDPTAMIAKTLIGSQSKHVGLHHQSQLTPPLMSVTHSQQQFLNSSRLSLDGSPLATLTNHLSQSQLHHHNHHQHHQQQQQQHQHQHHQQQQQHEQHKQSWATAAAAAVAAANPLHLFQIPMLSAAQAAISSSNSNNAQTARMAAPTVSIAQSAASMHQQNSFVSLPHHHPLASTLLANQRLPIPQDQINLVEELDQVYGPLAIYAWLKAEQFNLQKIRDIIETSKVPFDELLQSTGFLITRPYWSTKPILVRCDRKEKRKS